MQYLATKGTILANSMEATNMVQPPKKATPRKVVPEVAYLLLAGNSIRDTETLKFSYIDIFDLVRIPPNLGFVYQSFFVGGRINNVSAGHSITEVSIISPDKSVFATSSVEGNLHKGDLGFSAVFELLKFDKPGRYYLRVAYDGVQLKDDNKYYFHVRVE